MAELTPVRTTLQPNRVLWVDRFDLLDLRRQGLLLDATAPRPEDAGAAPVRRTKKTAGSGGDKE